jgi:hypothetical protein
MINSKWARTSASLVALLLISFSLYSCKDKSEIVGGGSDINNPPAVETIALSGQVINYVTGAPIKDATVDIKGGSSIEMTLITDSQGKYAADIESSSNVNLTIIASKDNFVTDTLSVFATIGQPLNAPPVVLHPTGSGTIPSGDPVSIYIASVSFPTIGVKESGAQETTAMVFVVQDSAGIPVDLDHSVTVNFYIAAGPGGGELLSPSSVNTNNLGQAVVNLTSGTKAGVVQVIAEVLPAKTIKSQPVSVTIHGGLPDQDHFSIAPAKVNFAGYNIYGLQDGITAFVGDKYANPVRPGTAVYFTTTGGIIEGSTLTDDQGIGSVQLISSAPQPNDPVLGPGFGRITATTVDENQTVISDETVVLFSGVPQISINPTSFDIPNGGTQLFTYTVSDQNNNPLVEGTTIVVQVEGEDTGASGDLNVTLPDTQSPLWTQFGFSVYDVADTTDQLKTVTVKITSSGPNGGAHIIINGVHH